MSTVQDNSGAANNPLLASQAPQTVNDYLRGYMRRIRGGDIGALPIIIGLVIIAIIFQTANSNYLTPRNLVNLIVQMAAITSMAYGVVYILLLGEIDLSISYVSAVGGVGMALLLRPPPGWPEWIPAMPWFVAIPLALAVVSLIGFVQGKIITYFQLPAFVVTLAGFLVWSGATLILIGGAGTVIIQDKVVLGIANSFLPPEVGWIAGILFIAFIAFTQYSARRTRQSKGLSTRPVPVVVGQVVILAVIIGIAIYISNLDRGVPFVGVLILLMLGILDYIATRTRFGRYVYAVGGNKEAARRAGINVERIRVIVFMISSFMAGVGGIILASRLRSVATNTGGGDLLLNSIASAVIGGTSLFGGRGTVQSAILGALIISSVDNGMGLLPNVSAGAKFVVTGLVLLVAVVVDAISRRSQQQSGIR
ncbi:MAG: ABC transporter permease [Anaerolineaceae bacterium]|nr:ABC transporter permease [Anaerolineaceae bacterium]